MNGTIRYHTKVFPSRRLPYKFLYSIKTRETMYGIHKEDDTHISKTSLVVFIEKKYANIFKDFIEINQTEKKYNDRIISSDNTSIPIQSRSIMPLQIQKKKTADIELMSIINYFDILIVSKINYQDDNTLYVYGFDYIIDEIPSRTLIEYQLNNSLNQYDK